MCVCAAPRKSSECKHCTAVLLKTNRMQELPVVKHRLAAGLGPACEGCRQDQVCSEVSHGDPLLPKVQATCLASRRALCHGQTYGRPSAHLSCRYSQKEENTKRDRWSQHFSSCASTLKPA
ncbi:uncharacterized protein LOC120850021 [Ixodes scapularis]|uniref:uncharacterized protein LOC120850021 n=1 Tax=Ixodes scapularis TaxID=6945 RepID=UPI001A9D6DC7|nr:uncharacterized protein LOC120850021 [Ixodes scapularis]